MTGGVSIEKLRVRYSLDPLNLLDHARVGSVYNEFLTSADRRCLFLYKTLREDVPDPAELDLKIGNSISADNYGLI